MPRFYSFVLPAYKARFFKKALDSILSQTYSNFELIIVNDASPDDLDTIVASYDDPRIRYVVNKENVGGVSLIDQWNNSLDYATGDYVILASDDDLYHPDYLLKMDNLVNKYPNACLFRPRVQHIDENDNIIRVETAMKEYVTNTEYLYCWLKNWVSRGVPFWVCKRKALKKIKWFQHYPLAWYADDDMVYRLAESGIAISDEILFSFRMSSINISSSRNKYSSLLEKLTAINKFYEFIDSYKDNKLIANEAYVEYMSGFIKSTISKHWVNNEINGLMFTSRFIDLLRMTVPLLKCPTFDLIDLLKLYLRYFKRKLL